MSVDMTTQSIAVGDNWVKVGNDYVGDNPSGTVATITALDGISFDGLTNGQSITGLVDFWGTFGNGYGCQGDTSIKPTGATSSVKMSIQSGTTGRPNDGTPAGNGDFGFIHAIDPANAVAEGEELWTYGSIYIPSNFDFDTGQVGLKFLRYGYPSLGAELDVKIAAGDEFGGVSTDNAGFHLVNETYPQLSANTNKESNRVFNKGAWNFFCHYTKASTNQASSEQRIWINDEFVFELVGGASQVAAKWIDDLGATQTASWTPSGAKWATLADSNPTITNIYVFTYWNGNASQDQSLNLSSLQYVKSSSGLSLDEFSNRYVNSGQV